MQIDVRKAELLKELRILGKTIDRQPAVPVTAHIFCVAQAPEQGKGGRLFLAATNPDTTVATSCPAQITDGGELLLPARQWSDLVQRLGDDRVQITGGEGPAVLLRCRDGEFQLPRLQNEPFPVQPAPVRVPFGVSAGLLLQALKGVQFSMPNEPDRLPVGIEWTLTRSGASVGTAFCADLRLVATDGCRMSVAWLSRSVSDRTGALSSEAASLSFGLRRRGVTDLVRLLSAGGAEELAFSSGEPALFFQAGHRQMWSRPLNRSFPKVEPILDKKPAHRAVAPVRRLLKGVQRLLVLADRRTPWLRMELKAGQLALAVTSEAGGGAVETLDVGYDGPSLAVGINGRYLLEILESSGSSWVSIGLTDETLPVWFEPVIADTGISPSLTLRHLVMPMRL
jgi:DNA polymerase-3 subunit beta